MTGDRYLPITHPDGSLIARADLYLLARMGTADAEDQQVVMQIFQAMLDADNTEISLNSFEAGIEKRHVRNDVPLRVAAGQVMLELVRICATTMTAPSVKKAVTLVAHNTYRHVNKSSIATFERQARKGFSDYRNTAHLQAAALLPGTGYADIEGDEDATKLFLGKARALESFFDANVAGGDIKWRPWRVPHSIPAISDISLIGLSAEEKALISLK